MNSRAKTIIIVVAAMILLMIGFGLQKSAVPEGQNKEAAQVQKEETAQDRNEKVKEEADSKQKADSKQEEKSKTASDAETVKQSEAEKAEYRDEVITDPDTVILPGDDLEEESAETSSGKQGAADPKKNNGPSEASKENDIKDSTAIDSNTSDNSSKEHDQENESGEEGIELPVILFD